MIRLIMCCGILLTSVALAGCGGTSSEIAPATEATGTNPAPEQQRNWQEESRRMMGGPKEAQKEHEQTKTEGAGTTTTN